MGGGLASPVLWMESWIWTLRSKWATNVETILEFEDHWETFWGRGRTISLDLQETDDQCDEWLQTACLFMPNVEPSGCVLVRTAIEEDSIYGTVLLAFAVLCDFWFPLSWLKLIAATQSRNGRPAATAWPGNFLGLQNLRPLIPAKSESAF